MRGGPMQTEQKSWLARLVRNPVAIIGAIGSIFVVFANAGPALDGATNLWRRLTQPPARLETNWQGTWKSRSGYNYAFAMLLEVDESAAAKGQIRWELVATPPDSHLVGRVGETAIEYVSGEYDRAEGLAMVTGYLASDQTLIALDTYKFHVKPDKVSFVGMSKYRGEWEAEAGGTVIVTQHK
jgi:hypothetical protein